MMLLRFFLPTMSILTLNDIFQVVHFDWTIEECRAKGTMQQTYQDRLSFNH